MQLQTGGSLTYSNFFFNISNFITDLTLTGRCLLWRFGRNKYERTRWILGLFVPCVVKLFRGLPWDNEWQSCKVASYPGYFQEPHWTSMGLLEISRVTLRGMEWMDETCSVLAKTVPTHQTFPKARPKCLMGNFTNSYRIYKAHQTDIWWTMKVFCLHCVLPTGSCTAQGWSTWPGVKVLPPLKLYNDIQYHFTDGFVMQGSRS